MSIKHSGVIASMLAFLAIMPAYAAVSVSPLFSDNMVLQREKPVPVYGTAIAGRTITVIFNGQTTSAVVDAQGNWQVALKPMVAKNAGGTLTIAESGGGNTLTFTNVVVGDIWLCSGQSNMDFGLNGCNRQVDIDGANFPGIRYITIGVVTLPEPTRNFSGSWTVCSPGAAGGFAAVPFYFARKIYQDQGANVPIGMLKSAQGGTCIDPWLAPEGVYDIPVLRPLYSQNIIPWGPFCLFNGMIYPLTPFAIKGVLWYQGEYGETSNQGPDSYYFKQRGLVQGWRRIWGEDLPFYFVVLANLDASAANPTPEAGGWPVVRDFQRYAMAFRGCGTASALDVGETGDIHPKDKWDVGDRLALWALRNEYGRTDIVPSGPVLRDVTEAGGKLVCTFDYVGAGLMMGYKTTNTVPTVEMTTGTLQRFSIAGVDGKWHTAVAAIKDGTVEVSSPSVPTPRKVAYAYWKNPDGANLYNRNGLPALPFCVDDVTAKYTISASTGKGGSITPAGANTLLKRTTALYTITPNAKQYIEDVNVDGVSVGAVQHYTLDPVYTNHIISATFTTKEPEYTITAVPGAGGTMTPSGKVSVAQGGRQAFRIVAGTNGHILRVIADGVPVGIRSGFAFNDVRMNHSITALFACTVAASASYGGAIKPGGGTEVIYGQNQTFTFEPIPGFAVKDVVVDGKSVGAATNYTFRNVTRAHSIFARFAGSGSGSLPQAGQIVIGCLADALPDSGAIESWPAQTPAGKSFAKIGMPEVEKINGKKFVMNSYRDFDGFACGTYDAPIECKGASIVAAVRPIRNGIRTGWNSIIDVFYDRLTLGILSDMGQVCVRRNGSVDTSVATIPDGQVTVLSLVVQPDGTYHVWANGVNIMTNTVMGDMTKLVPGAAGTFAKNITIGRNAPDGWTTFNGNIGDVFLYKTALTDAERQDAERFVVSNLAGTDN